MFIIIIIGILIINSQNRIHSTVQKFTWGVHASTVNLLLILHNFQDLFMLHKF